MSQIFIPLETPSKIKHLHENVSAFFVVGKICPTGLENFYIWVR